jgi:glycosyltransferase involved in cell wall biosynthesis
MIPTRNRVSLLKECLDSLNTKTSDPSMVELLVKADDDDSETLTFIKSYASTLPLKIVISPRKNGYGSLHEHYDSLAKVSESEFLMVFNDDIEMITHGWEQKFLPYSGTNLILAVRNERERNGVRSPIFENYNGNPSIPYELYKTLGTLSHHPMLDDWWVLVTRAIREQNFELERWLDVTLWFKRPDGVETDLPADTTFLEGRRHINWSHRGSPELNEYINNLVAHMNRCPHKFITQP